MGKERPILFINKYDCCGCGACAASCPKDAITMLTDEEGFLYPTINYDRCVSCLLCIRVCPFKGIKG